MDGGGRFSFGADLLLPARGRGCTRSRLTALAGLFHIVQVVSLIWPAALAAQKASPPLVLEAKIPLGLAMLVQCLRNNFTQFSREKPLCSLSSRRRPGSISPMGTGLRRCDNKGAAVRYRHGPFAQNSLSRKPIEGLH
jgi:hypothetical protein